MATDPYTNLDYLVSNQDDAYILINSWFAALASRATGPRCHVYHNAAQSIPNLAATMLAFNTELFDTDGMHDTVTNNSRITIQAAGDYFVMAQVDWANNVTGVRNANLKVNNTTYIGGGGPLLALTGTEITRMTAIAFYRFIVGDYVQVEVGQSSGGALNVLSSTAISPRFSAIMIGATV